MIDTDKYKIEDDVVWVWNDSMDPEDEGWVLWEYKECPNGYTVGNDPNKTYSPHHQVLPSLIFECKIDERMDAITDLPLIIQEVKRLREQVECSKREHEWELYDYLDGDPNKPVRIVETCAACDLVRERIE